nr:immunoglobulin heavy chain junction region [Macaca mulatta]MOW48886.1 immunoglobulin heavy chain junction region [Macaca mulatta]MOW50198.1 immunoglobulin heavy chain junction region [Macaca mulatta]
CARDPWGYSFFDYW